MQQIEVFQFVQELCEGNENAYHSLIEASHEIVPVLIQQFAKTENGECRALITEVIWQHRLPSTISFLTSALNDNNKEVWNQALDGLVAIGGEKSRIALQEIQERMSNSDIRYLAITEAIEQIG